VPDDDDLTVEADGDITEEIRRMAAEARGQTPPQATGFDPEATIDGDSAALEKIRRMAADAKSGLAKPPPSPGVLPEVRNAPAPPAPTQPAHHAPQPLPPPPDPGARVAAPVARRSPTPPLVSPTPGAVTPPLSGARWEPPARMLAPTEPPKDTPSTRSNYRFIAAILAMALAGVILLVATGVIGGSRGPGSVDGGVTPTQVDQPTQDSAG